VIVGHVMRNAAPGPALAGSGAFFVGVVGLVVLPVAQALPYRDAPRPARWSALLDVRPCGAGGVLVACGARRVVRAAAQSAGVPGRSPGCRRPVRVGTCGLRGRRSRSGPRAWPTSPRVPDTPRFARRVRVTRGRDVGFGRAGFAARRRGLAQRAARSAAPLILKRQNRQSFGLDIRTPEVSARIPFAGASLLAEGRSSD